MLGAAKLAMNETGNQAHKLKGKTMKRVILLLTVLICSALGSASLHAALSYWDSNGATAGAGNPPNSFSGWDVDAFWSPSSLGTSLTTTWPAGNTAVFSAGTDALDAYTVNISVSVNAGGITFEEGMPTITGGTINMTTATDFPIICNTNAVIDSELSGTSGFKKTGPGKLTLGSTLSNYGGTNTIVEGVVGITAEQALGNFGAPTIVSNGAALEVTQSNPVPEPVILNGFGVNNSGALYGVVNSSNNTTDQETGGAVLGSDARINANGTGSAWWSWSGDIIKTNGHNNADLYLGGTGNTLRLNMNTDYPNPPIPGTYRQPVIDIGDGVLTKDGSVELRVENASVARELHFNGGHIMGRCGEGTNICYRAVVPGFFYCSDGSFEGAFWSSGQYVPATIYVGAGAGQFRNNGGGPSQTYDHPMVLAAGANPVFRPQAGLTFTCNGEISGRGGLSKFDDAGTLFLNGTNTYSGNTVIRGGVLALGANGSIANSAVIDVQTDGTFDVSSVTAIPYVIGAAQTLKGNGTVVGDVTVNGTISPGASIGALTFNNNLTIAGNLVIEVDRVGFPANDSIAVSGVLTSVGTGALMVVNTNTGAPLQVGDSFTIFSQPVVNGQTLAVFGSGVVWANTLNSDGKITVAPGSPAVAATNLKVTAIGLNSVTLGGTGGANQCYGVSPRRM